MSKFSFKNIIKSMPNVKIPKSIIYGMISVGAVVTIGAVSSNMYVHDMAFFEGIEKSAPLFTEEEIREYGAIYDELNVEFNNKIGNFCQDYANRTNRFGEKIHYGIYNRNYDHKLNDTNKIKMHSNGNKKVPVQTKVPNPNNFKWDSSFLENNEFKNGVNIKYTKTKGREDNESNFQDILTVVSMILDQKQGKDGSSEDAKDYKEKVPRLIKELFNATHTFTGETTELYPCTKGCRVLHYFCNEVDSNFRSTGIELMPFEVSPHDDYENYDDESFRIIDPIGECVICGHDGKGCELNDEPCFHGSYYSCSDEDGNIRFESHHSIGDTPGGEGCTKYTEKEHCSHYNCECEDECSHDDESGIGCAGCYECIGHEHYDCPGHFYVCCPGHCDVTITVKIMYIEEILEYLKGVVS